MAYMTGWACRKSVTLSRASGAVTNYQMKLLVGESSGATGEDVDCGGMVASDFSDLRFTTSDGTTLLDYWIESVSGATPNQLATVWIEFNSIGTGATTFYMYYGGYANPAATSLSNGDNTFILFDDFAAGSLDSGKWDTFGTVTVTTAEDGGSALKLAVNDNVDNAGIRSKSALSSCATRSKIKFGSGLYGLTGLLTATTVVPMTIFNNNGVYTAESYITSVNKQRESGALSGNTSYQIYDIKYLNSVGQSFLINDSAHATHTSTILTSTNLRYWIAGYTTPTIYCDWAIIRQYVNTEPAWGSWGAVETPTAANYLHERRNRMNMRAVSSQNNLA